jgi:threonine dehydrogenase-like Zn-dependent dehydrogenase
MAIQTVGVVGCGLMGAGIAQVCAEAGYSVVVREVQDDLLKKGLARIDAFLQKGVDRGKVTAERKAEVVGRLQGTTDLAGLGACDIVVEAVVESLAAKREVYEALEEGSTPRLAGELGDLLLQIILHAQFAASSVLPVPPFTARADRRTTTSVVRSPKRVHDATRILIQTATTRPCMRTCERLNRCWSLAPADRNGAPTPLRTASAFRSLTVGF